MAERQKRPKMVFRKFLKDNKKSLEEFSKRKGDKYTREPWMLKANPAADWTMEIICEEDQCGN